MKKIVVALFLGIMTWSAQANITLLNNSLPVGSLVTSGVCYYLHRKTMHEALYYLKDLKMLLAHASLSYLWNHKSALMKDCGLAAGFGLASAATGIASTLCLLDACGLRVTLKPTHNNIEIAVIG